MIDEYEEWRLLDARITAWESGEGPPLAREEEARWEAILDGWPLALEQARTAERLLCGTPDGGQRDTLRRYVDALAKVTAELGRPVPLWMGLARAR